MNKLKLLYDVFTVLRNKEVIAGIAQSNISKDQRTIFSFENEFTKNLVTRQSKSCIRTTLDYEGKQLKHQSTTEFSNLCGHGFFRRHHHGRGHGCCSHGLKGKLSKLALAFQLLNQLQAEEQADHTTLITLELTELPPELKECFAAAKARHEGHEACPLLTELGALTQGSLSLAIVVDQDRDIEKITLVFDGVQRAEHGDSHKIQATGELKITN